MGTISETPETFSSNMTPYRCVTDERLKYNPIEKLLSMVQHKFYIYICNIIALIAQPLPMLECNINFFWIFFRKCLQKKTTGIGNDDRQDDESVAMIQFLSTKTKICVLGVMSILFVMSVFWPQGSHHITLYKQVTVILELGYPNILEGGPHPVSDTMSVDQIWARKNDTSGTSVTNPTFLQVPIRQSRAILPFPALLCPCSSLYISGRHYSRYQHQQEVQSLPADAGCRHPVAQK